MLISVKVSSSGRYIHPVGVKVKSFYLNVTFGFYLKFSLPASSLSREILFVA
jgi:hypothetical protein